MGRELAACSPVFAARLAECGRALAPFTGWSLDDVLAGAGDGLDRVEVVQPALWAVMVSLAAAWQAAGTRAGRGGGSFTGRDRGGDGGGGAVAGGRARVVALRSRALAALAGQGAMVAVASRGSRRPRSCCRAWPGLAVAAVNSPAATVVSGDPGRPGRCWRPASGPGSGPGRSRSATPRTPRRWRRSGTSWRTPWTGSPRGPGTSRWSRRSPASPGRRHRRRRVLVREPARPGAGSPARSRCWRGWATGPSSRCPRTRC